MADKNIAKKKEYPEGYWDRFGTTPGGVTWTSGPNAKTEENIKRLKSHKIKRQN